MNLSKPNLVVLSWYFCQSLVLIKCATMNDTNILLNDLLSGYNRRVRPVFDQDKKIIVNVSVLLRSLHELDEVHGMFSVYAGLFISWVDERMIWNSSLYGGIKEVNTFYRDVWVPELILTSPADDADSLGKKWQVVQFKSDGYATWLCGSLLKSTCAVNMRKYPFDRQVCKATFIAWGLTPNQVKLQGQRMEQEFTYFDQNNIWTVHKIMYEVPADNNIEFLFYLERKSAFIVLNVVLPLTLLNLLNAFVFLIVPESGERISFCITVLLSIAVFMTIVSDTLPKSSEPVPIISYKLMFDFTISATIVLVTIFNLRLFHKSGMAKVPRCLKKLCITLAIDSRRKRKVKEVFNNEVLHQRKSETSRKTEGKENPDIDDVLDVVELGVSPDEDIKIPWKRVSVIIDYTAFAAFVCISIVSFVTFIITVQ